MLCHSQGSILSIVGWPSGFVFALNNPNGIQSNSYRPKGVVNAIFWRSSGWTGMCQYPLARSRVEEHFVWDSSGKAFTLR